MRVVAVALGTALVVSVGLNIFLYREWSRQLSEVPYNRRFHGDLIEEAINRYSAQIGVSREDAMRNRFPVAMTIPDKSSPGGEMRCVALKLRKGWLGFTPVYCFDRNGLKSEARF